MWGEEQTVKWFVNRKVGTKLVLAFLVVASISLIIGAIGIRNMATINGLADEMYRKELLGVLYAQNSNKDLVDVARAEKNIILADTAEKRNKFLADYEKKLAQLDDDMAKTRPLVYSEKESLALARIDDANQDWRKVSRQVVDTAMSGQPNAIRDAALLSMGDARVKLDIMDYLISDLVALKRDGAKSEADRTAAIFRQSLVVMLAFIIGGVLLGVVLGLVISRMISVPLKKGLEFSQAIAAGDLTRAIDIDRRDEIGMLAREPQHDEREAAGDDRRGPGKRRAGRQLQQARSPPARRSSPKAPRTRPPRLKRQARPWRSSPLPWTRWPSTRRARPRVWSKARPR